MTKQITGLVFDIQRYALHDGPGIRTVVFIKGCPLRCIWCCNPEGQVARPQIMYDASLCSGCSHCVQACSQQANTVVDGRIRMDRERCRGCGVCVKECPTGARKLVGEHKSVEAVLTEIKKDELFYRNSGGGVTVSGGEVMTAPKFAHELIRSCRDNGFHTAIETTGYADWRNLHYVSQDLELVLYDIKHFDSTTHRKLTGVPNELILENCRRLAAEKPMVVRIPLIPGLNDSIDNVRKTARFVRTLREVTRLELLPYHKLAMSKYDKLGLEYKWNGPSPDRANMIVLKSIVEAEGIICEIY